MNRGAYLCVAVAALVACGGDKDMAKNDPDRPAVIQAPPVVLPSDTAKPDTMPAYLEKVAQAGRELSNEYAVLAAASVLGDVGTVGSFYSTDAILKLGDSTYTGPGSIAVALVALMRRSSVKEFVRLSVRMSAIDSVFSDSGVYGILAQRQGGKPAEERGTYAAEWVFGGTPKRWAMRRDAITAPVVPSASKRR